MPDGAHGTVTPEVGNPGKLVLDFLEKNRRVTERHDRDHLRLDLVAARVAVPARHPDRAA